ncbi:MAG TPA: hypothetical protein VGQ04_11785 [Chitinophagaceae bacterium]|jgi:hypothetical protein|nr:hypothetical protein [Chitinophagaceae bacterium]
MKKVTVLSSLLVLVISVVTSCIKQTEVQLPVSNQVDRKVQFGLYTDKDLSGDNNTITFKLSILKITNEVSDGSSPDSPTQVLWDSILAPMKIKEIPQLAQKLVIEKTVIADEASLLKVGFFYTIENVGHATHFNTFPAGETFKIVDFNFQ